MNEPNFSVIIFKNNKKRKILKSFVTEQKAIKFYEKKVKESSEIHFDKQFENGLKCSYRIILTSKICEFDKLHYLDDLGRNISINPKISDNLYIKKIDMFKKEEKIYDVQENKKISFSKFSKKYLDKEKTIMISKLNNKVVVQEDDNYFLFSLKTEDECERFLTIIESKVEKKNFIIVRDFTSPQRKYLYDLLVSKGYDIDFLYRTSTTHPKER
jgi:transcriptional regulator with PAS, ATPase and Fis domain